MANNQTAYDAFWKGESGKGSSTSSTGDRLFSYSTVILQRLPDGKVIGNTTRYSSTTTKHQKKSGVRNANMLIAGVPSGTIDLIPYTPIYKEEGNG